MLTCLKAQRYQLAFFHGDGTSQQPLVQDEVIFSEQYAFALAVKNLPICSSVVSSQRLRNNLEHLLPASEVRNEMLIEIKF